ncbi:SLAP domain-containing protein [Companilactobacillus halodurans]|uniref:S-layer protein C-terminal domain-containing protein n=1 Tax=Companilactobacillus halodurans TaxID=2584183 RepID=A0A5P0ZMI6_9LACO|nr:SLAP domain-containing protein [Companilactobacillus halodurans]MQS75480.1 hypothetical protein [Companilactobacillus halodurans]MQS97472.1 hypothetical protein [Companilactobacillus halodurans]
MKKTTSLLLSGVLVSGMVLGGIITPTAVNAASAVTQASENVTNKVTYYLASNSEQVGQPVELEGTIGAKITNVPDGYTLADGENATYVKNEGSDNSSVGVTITPLTSAKINFVDQNNKLVKSETVNGGVGNSYTISNLPAGCSWPKDANKTITLEQGKEYNVPVEKEVSNTVIFKTADQTEVGRTQIFGDKAGDSISLTDEQIPAGYATDGKALTLQTEGNTQIVTVTKATSDVTPFTGKVKVGKTFTNLYTVKGEQIKSRALAADSYWMVANKLVLNGKTYYQVATTEWVPADNVTVVSQETSNDDIVQKADRNVVTTKDVAYTKLYTQTGDLISNRGLGAKSAWATDKMTTVNGVKMYRVATNEWVKVTDIVE